MEAAFKASIRKEMEFLKPQALCEEFLPVGVSCEDFLVDELLDLSNGEGFVNEEEEDGAEVPLQEINEATLNVSLADYELGMGIPVDDLASLEWLSHVVEDSNTEYATPFPDGIRLFKDEDKVETEVAKPEPACSTTMFNVQVPAKARSKRTRVGVRAWSGGHTFAESSSASSSSSSSASYTSIGTQLPLVNPPAKMAKHSEGVSGRRCSHCGVHKTPQWRAGPLGAKTLCNACGVRYKSGRLLPEYRPACSPTFSSELHSNSHRKVLEMRKKKQSVESSALTPCTTPFPDIIAVPSF